MRPSDVSRASVLDANLFKYESEVVALPGIRSKSARAVLVEQMIESLRRIEFVHFVRDGKIDPRRADPSSRLFDPLRAAAFRLRQGDVDEAFWLVLLATHFGKHVRHGWGLAAAVYAGTGGKNWTWKSVNQDVSGFRQWLAKNEASLRSKFAFSNHRKYQSLGAYSNTGTGAVVASYLAWISPPRTHRELIQEIHKSVGQNPKVVFDAMYRSMDAVIGFGRLGKFDFLTMLGKLGIAPVEPGSAYLVGATGPLQGVRLLFANDTKAKIGAQELQGGLSKLDEYLGVGMQVLEDSLCNWQKSPKKFVSFRG